MNPVDSLTYYAFLVSKTTDAGATWHRDTLQVSTSSMYGKSVAVSPANRNHVYAAGYNGIFYRSTDAGATWTLLNSGLTSTGYIYDIAPHPTNPNIIYVGASSGGVYRTTDAGTTWTRMGTLTAVNDVMVHPFGPDTVYVGANAGFYLSTNAGSTWTQQNSGLLDPYITSLAMNTGGPDSSFLFCGIRGGGLHRRYLSIIPVEEQAGDREAAGLTIGPNPARDRVNFHYCLSQPCRITIGVYDVQGRRIEAVVDGYRPAGEHGAEWDCRHQAAGVYFVKAFTDRGRETRTLIIVR